MTDFTADYADTEDFYLEDKDGSTPEESFATALAAEWSTASWHVSSFAIHLLIFLILFLIPVTRPTKSSPLVMIETAIEDPIVIDDEIEKPQVEVVEKKILEDVEIKPEDILVSVQEFDDTLIESDEEVAEVDDEKTGNPNDFAFADSQFTGTPAILGVGASGGSGGNGGKFGRGRGAIRRKAYKNGGNTFTERRVKWGLKWLAEHQEYDGYWSCSKFGGSGQHKGGAADTHANGGDEAVTGLALLAFLGAGNSVDYGRYRDTVRRGAKWLLTRQQPSGVIGIHKYVGGITLMAIAEVYGMAKPGRQFTQQLRVAAQKAVDWGVKSQCDKGGWNYSPGGSRNDQSVTGWWVMGLKSAYVAGLKVPMGTFKKALHFHREWTNEYGASGYCAPASEKPGSIRMSAVANTCLQFLGEDRNSGKLVATAQLITAPQNLPGNGRVDFYLMYYQALGLFQMGTKSPYWLVYNEKMKALLLGTQVMTGTVQDKKGSWNYADAAFGESWGRVGETALGSLMLEVYYRYKEGSSVLTHR